MWRVTFTVIRFTRLLVNFISRATSHPPAGEVHGSMPLMDNIDQKKLIAMLQEKTIENLNGLGGAERVAAILGSDVKEGLSAAAEDDLERRRQEFGANRCKKQPKKGFARLFLEPLKEKTSIILFACAVMSLAFGIKQHGLKEGCYDGATNVIGVFLAVIVSSTTKYILSRQFLKASYEMMSRMKVEVVRGGRHVLVSLCDIVVGDVACLRAGNQVPADGLLLEGYSLKVNESTLSSGHGRQVVEVNSTTNPFLLSGSKVISGFGFMIVTSVGMNTTWGKIMSSRNDDLIILDEQQTPIKAYLNKLTSRISKAGLAVAMVVSMIQWFNHKEKNIVHMVEAMVGFINKTVTIVVLAIPEGLPLAATLTLAYSMKQMMNDAMVLKLAAYETMASATTICTDITGTLTLNQRKIEELWLAKEAIEFNTLRETAPEVYVLLQEGIALNTTGTVENPAQPISSPNVSGSPTEKAILSWAVLDMDMDVNQTKETCKIIHLEVSIHPETKRSGALLIRKRSENEIHTHWRGDAEMILAMCSSYYVKTVAVDEMHENGRLQFKAIIQSMAAKA